MSLVAEPPALDRSGEIEWSPVSGVQQVVYVGREDGEPVAIIQFDHRGGFALTTCVGLAIGTYSSIEEAQQVFEELRAAH